MENSRESGFCLIKKPHLIGLFGCSILRGKDRMVEAVYKPRNPESSPLYQSILDHFAEFESVYEDRYQKRYGVLRDIVREVVDKYLGCGDLRKGFARIKCKDCKHEVLLAFSCKGRYFYPFKDESGLQEKLRCLPGLGLDRNSYGPHPK